MGYDIYLKTMNTLDHLTPEEIMQGLKTKTIGSAVVVYKRIASTMDMARKLARMGAKNGTVVFAEEQTQGKGRSGHSWSCPPYTGLLCTIVLKHTIQPDHLCLLTGTTAVSVTETIYDTLHLPAEIKWPNDILINGKKVGGILVELEKSLKKQFYFFIGIGINVNTPKNELPKQTRIPATSLAIENNGLVDRTMFAKALLQDIDKWYSILKDEHFRYITERWKELCITVGETLTITDGGQEYTGVVIDISNNGGLMVRLDNGLIKIFRGEHATIKYG